VTKEKSCKDDFQLPDGAERLQNLNRWFNHLQYVFLCIDPLVLPGSKDSEKKGMNTTVQRSIRCKFSMQRHFFESCTANLSPMQAQWPGILQKPTDFHAIRLEMNFLNTEYGWVIIKLEPIVQGTRYKNC
jgi:hypothetical protein